MNTNKVEDTCVGFKKFMKHSGGDMQTKVSRR